MEQFEPENVEGRDGLGLVDPERHNVQDRKSTCKNTLLELHPGAQVSKTTCTQGACFEVMSLSSSFDTLSLK